MPTPINRTIRRIDPVEGMSNYGTLDYSPANLREQTAPEPVMPAPVAPVAPPVETPVMPQVPVDIPSPETVPYDPTQYPGGQTGVGAGYGDGVAAEDNTGYIQDWANEAIGTGYDANTYNSRMTNLLDRYKQAGITDEDLRASFGRNVYDDWVSNIRTGAKAVSTGFDRDMDPLEWDLGTSSVEPFEGWTGDEYDSYWEDAYNRVNEARNESRDWAGQYQTNPQEVGLLSDRLNTVLQNDDNGVSQYIDRARTQAMEQAGSRGLLNSTMASGAAEGAAIDRGLEVAQGDVDVDKFNVGADTAAQNARFTAAQNFANQAQGTLDAMSGNQGDMINQMLMNKQAHGMELTIKEQAQLDALELAKEGQADDLELADAKQQDALETAAQQQADLLEGKTADFDYATQEAAQQQHYDVLASKLDFDMKALGDAALYEHQLMLKKLEGNTALYQGYIESTSAINASNLSEEAKTAAIAEQNGQYTSAIESMREYQAVSYTGDSIDFSDEYDPDKEVGILEGVSGGEEEVVEPEVVVPPEEVLQTVNPTDPAYTPQYSTQDLNAMIANYPDRAAAINAEINDSGVFSNFSDEMKDDIRSAYVDMYGMADGEYPATENNAGSVQNFNNPDGSLAYKIYKPTAQVSQELLTSSYNALSADQKTKMEAAVIKYVDEYEAWSGKDFPGEGNVFSWVSLQSYLEATT